MTAPPWISQAIYDVDDPEGRIKRVVTTRGLIAVLQAGAGEAFVLLDSPEIDTSAHRVVDGVIVAAPPADNPD